MKKAVSIALTMCLLVGMLPFFVYAVPFTEKISLEQFKNGLMKIQREYDDGYVGEIVVEDGERTYSVDGKKDTIKDKEGRTVAVEIDEDSLDIPDTVLEKNSAEIRDKARLSGSSKESSEEYAKKLGYDVLVKDDTAVLSQPYQTHRLIVKSKFKINTLDSVACVEGYNDLHILQFDDLESTLDALDYYKKQSTVEYAEPDSVMSACAYGWHQSWGSLFVEYDSFIDTMVDTSVNPIDTSNLSQIVVAVVDSGIELTHSFLQDRVIPTGFNVSGSGNANSETDDNGHGTHVAGIVVDNTTDNVMVSGYKCLDDTGYGPLSSVCACVDKAVEDGVDVINLSLSEEGWSDLMHESVLNAIDHGITVVAAAGNDGLDASTCNPANIDECITVAAMDPLEGSVEKYHLASFSNYGDIVDVIAPGKNIGSCWLDDLWKSLDGTSMAAPFVSAAAALLLSVDPRMTGDDVMAYIAVNASNNWVKTNKLPKASALYMGGNGVAVSERTIKPTLSVLSGNFSHSFNLTISCAEDAAIYYTTDGEKPNLNNAALYTGPIPVRETSEIYAFAIADGKEESLPTYAKYNLNLAAYGENGNYTVDEDGYIISYNGGDNPSSLTVPNKVENITVRGISHNAFESVKETLTSVTLPDTVTRLEKDAFNGLMLLTNVNASNLTYIGARAFSGCENLANIDLSKVITIDSSAFSDCKALTGLNIPLAEAVCSYAFSFCTGISSVSLPKVKHIGKNAFYNCTALTDLSVPLVTTIGDSAFENCCFNGTLYLPEARRIGSSAFAGCAYMTNITTPKVLTVGNSAFSKCSLLSGISLPQAVSVGEDAFNCCTGMTVFSAPKITALSKQTFCSCYDLTTVNIPEVITVNYGAFMFCSSLSDLTAPKIISVGDCAFKGCGSLENYDFGNIESIGEGCFADSAIRSFINNKITVIPKEAFSGTAMLSTFKADSVTQIEDYGLYQTGLESVSLPAVTYLGEYALANNRSLKSFELPNVTLLASGGYQFAECRSLERIELPSFSGFFPKYATLYCEKLKELILPNVYGFASYSVRLTSLNFLYIPSVTALEKTNFSTENTITGNISTSLVIFAPGLSCIYSLYNHTDLRCYLSENAVTLPSGSVHMTVIAPSGSYAEQWATEKNQYFIDSSLMANTDGADIRLCDGGLRFSFSWELPDEIKPYIENTEYGFEYSVDGNEYTLNATNVLNGPINDCSLFNLVVNNIPQVKRDSVISVRAVVNCDGMVFKSPVCQRAYNELTTADVEGIDVNLDGRFNDLDYDAIMDIAAGITDYNSLDAATESVADFNGDGVIDGFDLAKLERYAFGEGYVDLPQDNIIQYPV